MNKYKRSLKKKKSKRNYKKRTINKNKKLQRGGVIQIGHRTSQGWTRMGNSNFEITFNKKNMQFYNAFLAAMDRESLKGCNPYLVEEGRPSGDDNPFIINLQGSQVLARSYNDQDEILRKHNDTDNHVKFGLFRHSESSANWLLSKPLEIQHGYITAFLTPYGRVLAYSTGYYKYAEHIMDSREILKFYSSTLPRSMITAMLVLRGIIDRLEKEDLKEIAEIYKQAEIQVYFGISEEPEPGTPDKNTGLPGIKGSSDSYAQRIMDANMMEPMIDFINDTESGDYDIRLVLNRRNRGPPRPFLWEEGDPTDAYRSSTETLNRFFNKLYSLEKGNYRHIFVVHGIIMEKYLSWVFFIKYFQDLIGLPDQPEPTQLGGAGSEGESPHAGSEGEFEIIEKAGAVAPGEVVPVASEPVVSVMRILRAIKELLSIGESESVDVIEQKWSYFLFLGGFNIETLRNMCESLNKLKEYSGDYESLLNDIQTKYREFYDKLYQNIEFRDDMDELSSPSPHTIGDVTAVDDEVDRISQFNNLFNQINDPRCMRSQWFTGKYGQLNMPDQAAKLKELLDKPYSKTPNNCVGVFGTVVNKKQLPEDRTGAILALNDENQDDLRNIYLLHYMCDVKFMSPSLRFKYCPPPLPQGVYSPLLESIQTNTPENTDQTDAMIMQTFSKAVFTRFNTDGTDILFKGWVHKRKRTGKWAKRYLVIRGNGIYFYANDTDPINNPAEARGSSCHDIRHGELKIENERYFTGDMKGKRPTIIIEFPLLLPNRQFFKTNEYIGTSSDKTDYQGRPTMEKFESMKFSFGGDALTDDEIRSQKFSRMDDAANAFNFINGIISGESEVSHRLEPEPDMGIESEPEPAPADWEDDYVSMQIGWTK
tara:strand:+ start:31 stop:2661 length:2631 start_codon:yes stop_codon:yes gene_type:complete